jgi:hypothetical protein
MALNATSLFAVAVTAVSMSVCSNGSSTSPAPTPGPAVNAIWYACPASMTISNDLPYDIVPDSAYQDEDGMITILIDHDGQADGHWTTCVSKTEIDPSGNAFLHVLAVLDEVGDNDGWQRHTVQFDGEQVLKDYAADLTFTGGIEFVFEGETVPTLE